MKKLGYVLYAILILAVVGLLVYDYLPDKRLDDGALTRAGVLVVGIVAGMLRINRPRRRNPANKKALYTNAYAKYIQNVFPDDKKSEKRFFDAVEDYNADRPAAAVEKLTRLQGECRNSSDRYAVTVFMALCLDELKLYDKAAASYRAALNIKPESTLYSNLGLVLDRLGKSAEAEDAYAGAIRLDPGNANPLNNLAQRYVRLADYEKGREYALKAIAINPKMHQALSAMAICSYMLGDQQSYQTYFRQAVSNGSNGEKIKAFIQSLNPEF